MKELLKIKEGHLAGLKLECAKRLQLCKCKPKELKLRKCSRSVIKPQKLELM